MVKPSTIESRRKILESTLFHIQKKSYNALRVQDIANDTGFKKASILYHFNSKVVLGVEAIKNYAEKSLYLTNKLDRITSDPWIKIDEFFKFFAQGVDIGVVCPGTAISAEINTVPEEIRQEINLLYISYLDWLTKLLDEGKEKGSFGFKNKSSEIALFIASSLSGAMLFARIFDDPKHFQIITNQLKNFIRN